MNMFYAKSYKIANIARFFVLPSFTLISVHYHTQNRPGKARIPF